MTPESTDFWNESSNTEVPEPPKASYDTLPDGVTIIARTTSSEDKETVHPKIKEFDGRDGPFYMAKFPLIVLGGDIKLPAKFIGRYLFLDLGVEKPTVERLRGSIASAEAKSASDGLINRLKGQLGSLDKYPCGPELYNFILDTLAPEGESATTRWAQARAVLAAKAKELDYTPAMFKGNTQYLYAETFKQVLMDKQYTVIGRTYTPRQKEGSLYSPQQTLGSIGSDTEEQRKKRRVKIVEAIARDDGGF
jgi:hypothetical protein